MKRRPGSPDPPQRGADATADDLDAWARATADVRPLAVAGKAVVSRVRKALPAPRVDEDQAPRGPVFDVDDGAGEGRVEGIDLRTLAALRRGEPAFTTKLDLHNMSRERARGALAAGLAAAAARGVRCVLVVHGRGLHSAEGRAVLKDALPQWLTTGPPAAIVLAFAPARRRDGGDGASYVLLRRPGRNRAPRRQDGTTPDGDDR